LSVSGSLKLVRIILLSEMVWGRYQLLRKLFED